MAIPKRGVQVAFPALEILRQEHEYAETLTQGSAGLVWHVMNRAERLPLF